MKQIEQMVKQVQASCRWRNEQLREGREMCRQLKEMTDKYVK